MTDICPGVAVLTEVRGGFREGSRQGDSNSKTMIYKTTQLRAGLRHPVSLLLVLATGSFLLSSDPASAQTTIIEDPNGRNIRDTNGDGMGDQVAGVDTLARVGEHTADADQTRYFLPFVLTPEERQAVAEGGRVELALSLGVKSTILDLHMDLFGFTERGSEVPVAEDFEAANAVLVMASALTPGTPTGVRTFDVTDFVKEQSAFGPVVAFRLQVSPPDVLPNADGVVNRYLLHTQAHATGAPPTLTVHPDEPFITGGSHLHRNLADSDGDGLGDWIDAGGDNLGRVGEHPTQDASQARWYLPFDLSAGDIEEILAAELVTLNLPYGISTAVTGLFVDEDPSIDVSEGWGAGNILDTTGDGLGDTVRAGETLARVGEYAQDQDQSRYFMPFILSPEQRQAVAAGARINLSFSYGIATDVSDLQIGEEVVDLNIDLYGYLGRTSEMAEAADYQEANVELLHAPAVMPGTPTGVQTFDVTDFVKEQSALGTVIGFRLQIDPADALPNADGALNRYLLHTEAHATAPGPRLEIYPQWPVAATDLEVEILGFTDRTSAGATAADYHASNVQVLVSPAPGLTSTGFKAFDITEFAKQEAAKGSILAFRLQIDPPDALPYADGLWNRYLFQAPGHASGNFPYIQVVDVLPFTAWLNEVYPGEEDPAIIGAFADPDGNGIPNLLEFALTGDPRQPDRSILPALGVAEVGGVEYLTITFTRLTEPLDIDYSVQNSGDLTDWMTDAILLESIDHEDGTLTETYRSPVPISEQERDFLRLEVEQVY